MIMMAIPSLLYQYIIYFALFPLILGLVLFFFSRINRKTKIIAFLIILPFLLRAIFGHYFFPPPLGLLLRVQSKILTEKAIKSKNSEVCLSIGELIPFFSLIHPQRAQFTSAPLQKNCVIAVALAEKDESHCNVLTSSKMAYRPYGSSYKNDCYAKVAEIKGDFSICEKLEGESNKAICYQRVFSALEKYKDILAECKKFLEEDYTGKKINECIKNIAIETKNIELCKGLSWVNMAIECKREIQIATSDILAPCKNLFTVKRKTECIKDIAIERNDINLCELAGEFSDECKKEIIILGRRNDLKLCEGFSGWAKEICQFEVAVNKNDITICDRGGPYNPTYWCYTGIAIKRGELGICSKIYAGSDDCIDELAVRTDNLDLCREHEPDQFNMEMCIAKIAVQRNDEKLCQTLSREDSKYKCVVGIAAKRGDFEMCKSLTGFYVTISYKDKCIKEVAIAQNNPKICGYIEKKYAQDLCYGEFGIEKVW